LPSKEFIMSQRLDHHAASPAGMKAMGQVYGYVSN